MWNFIVPAIVGAGISMLQNRDPIQGALIGGATGGLLGGGFEGFGSAIPSAGASAGTPTLGGLTLSGASTAGAGAGASALTAGGAGIATSTPQTAGGYSSLLGGDTMLQPNNIGMGGVTSSLNTAPTAGPTLGAVQGSAPGIDFPDYTPIAEPQAGGYVYSPQELEELENLSLFGPLTGGAEDAVQDTSVLDKITDTTGLEKKDLTLLGINQFAQLGDVKENKPGVVQLPDIKKKEPKIGKPVTTNVAQRRIRPTFYSA